jgi:hypothetical protein
VHHARHEAESIAGAAICWLKLDQLHRISESGARRWVSLEWSGNLTASHAWWAHRSGRPQVRRRPVPNWMKFLRKPASIRWRRSEADGAID